MELPTATATGLFKSTHPIGVGLYDLRGNMKLEKITLTKEQILHFRNCSYVETCDLCDWVLKNSKQISNLGEI